MSRRENERTIEAAPRPSTDRKTDSEDITSALRDLAEQVRLNSIIHLLGQTGSPQIVYGYDELSAALDTADARHTLGIHRDND